MPIENNEQSNDDIATEEAYENVDTVTEVEYDDMENHADGTT